MQKKERYHFVIEYFKKHRPVAETELEYTNPFNLLVATILSAQCTDKRVNMITPALLARYPTAEKMAQASAADIFEYIKSCSYPNSKSKHLVAMARKLTKDFGGLIPEDTEALQSLPGVGRKTAHVVASVVFHQPKLAVDTHVFRVATRIGLATKAKSPLQAERQLVEHIPEELIPIAHHWLILHGRYICQARKPRCYECGVRNACQYYTTHLSKRQDVGNA
jgi:endonuclease-3